jgi:hypothetical protein
MELKDIDVPENVSWELTLMSWKRVNMNVVAFFIKQEKIETEFK